jgi:repressor LexA
MILDKLTKKQSEILEFVIGYIREHEFSPSYREIADHFGISSTATVHEHIKNLESKGYLRGDSEGPRSIDVDPSVSMVARAVQLPLVGLITAGEPIEAMESNETIAVPADLAMDGINTYVLRVKGQSMIEDGILSGDYVVVQRNPSPKDGDVVVALLENTYATLKRFYREKGRIRLQPANSSMQPLYVKDLIVQGVVRAVIRDFHARVPA